MDISLSYIDQLFASFNKMRVLIVGDVMIDAYTEGSVERMSPEAPVPVFSVKKRYNRLGGATNVAVNVKALGAEPLVFSIIGDDLKTEKFMQLMRRYGLEWRQLIKSGMRITTVKERVICEGKQMIRIDEEQTNDLDEADQAKLLMAIRKMIDTKNIGCIILQDYNKGVLTPTVIEEVIAMARAKGIPVAVDPKKNNFLAYRGVNLFKPNAKELREGMAVEADSIEAIQVAAVELQKRLQCQMLMTTLSENGVVMLSKDGDEVRCQHIAAHPRDIKDVSGAGDTVLSVAALCMAANAEPYTIAALSNLAGGLVCEKFGAVPIDKEQLISEAKKSYAQDAEADTSDRDV